MGLFEDAYKRMVNEGVVEFIDDHCITQDFPIEGVKFIDILPLIKRYNLCELNKLFRFDEPIILLPEARGFLFAAEMDWGKVVLLRKKNKLPGDLVGISYKKEYGVDELFFQKSAILSILKSRSWDKSKPVPVCFFDDVLATGGTAHAIIKFFEDFTLEGYTFKVTSVKFYLEIKALDGRKLLESIQLKSGNNLTVSSVYEY